MVTFIEHLYVLAYYYSFILHFHVLHKALVQFQIISHFIMYRFYIQTNIEYLNTIKYYYNKRQCACKSLFYFLDLLAKK